MAHQSSGARAVVVGTVAVLSLGYAGRLSGPFIFDDEQAIVTNPTLSTLSAALFTRTRELPVSGRPVVNATFAIERALFGLSPTAFHTTNLCIHGGCVLLAYLLLRQLLAAADTPVWLRARAQALALISALVFAVHPLAAEVVLYATQRTEGLVALCYLSAFYLLVCSCRGQSRIWPWVLLVSVLGAGCKEVFATAPFVLACADRAFFAGSLRVAWQRRRGFYLALTLPSLLVLVSLQRTDPRPYSVRFAELDYLLAQAWVLPSYVWTVLSPIQPPLDYGPLQTHDVRAWWPWLVITPALLLLSAWAAWRYPRRGFVACWVLAILAPSSSLFSIHTEVGAGRRFYLPSIAVIAGAVVALAALFHELTQSLDEPSNKRVTLYVRGCAVIVLALLGVQTRLSAADYRSVRAYWSAAVLATPHNARAHYNLAETLRREGDPSAAITQLRAALNADPTYAEAHVNLAALLTSRGAVAEGLKHAQRGAALAPRSADAHYNLALAYVFNDQRAPAVSELERTLQLDPQHREAHRKLAQLQR